MKLEDLIAACVAAKTGDKEFALHFFPHDGTWQAGIGNPCVHVLLGESSPEISDEGKSAEEAVRDIARQLGVTP